MVRKVLNVRDPRLREVSKPVERIDKKVTNLIRDLKDTLAAQKDPEGVGLAGPQIGVPLRVFVVRYKGKMLPVINPEIIKASKKTNDPDPKKEEDKEEGYIMEGCLSLPHYYGPVQRSWSVELKYLQADRQEKVQKFTGFPAQIVQHEVDHLNGKVFVDRLLKQKRQLFNLHDGHWQEVELI